MMIQEFLNTTKKCHIFVVLQICRFFGAKVKAALPAFLWPSQPPISCSSANCKYTGVGLYTLIFAGK